MDYPVYGLMGGAIKKLKPPKNQRTVGAPKTKVIFDGVVHLQITRGVCTVVQVALRVLLEYIDGGRRLLVMQRQDSKDRLQTTRATQQMPRHGLGGVDNDLLGMRAKSSLDRIAFVFVTQHS